jgi:hypothetical protein
MYFELGILKELKLAAESEAKRAEAGPAQRTRSKLEEAAKAKAIKLRQLMEDKARSVVAARFDVRPGEFTTGQQRYEQLLVAVENAHRAELVDASIAGIQVGADAAQVARDLEDKIKTVAKRFFCIYDLLSVLSSLKALCFAADKKALFDLVEECEQRLKLNGEDERNRRNAIGRLKAYFTARSAFDAASWPSTMGKSQTIWGIIQAAKDRPYRPLEKPGAGDPAAKESNPGKRPRPQGGRRTFRRRGLPQLL